MERWARVAVADPPPATSPGMHKLRREYVKDADGWRTTSSNNHQPSIILHQFPRGYAGTYYYHFEALGSVVGLMDEDGYAGQLWHDKRQVSRVAPMNPQWKSNGTLVGVNNGAAEGEEEGRAT